MKYKDIVFCPTSVCNNCGFIEQIKYYNCLHLIITKSYRKAKKTTSIKSDNFSNFN